MGTIAGHEQGTVVVEVIVISNKASGHTSRFTSSLTGQYSSRVSDVDVGQVGTPDAVAFAEAVMVGKLEVEKVERVSLLWCLVRERGRALGDRVSRSEYS